MLLLGYGDSSGSPSEEGLVEDAVSVFKWLKSHTGSMPVYLWGHSLGSACVSYLNVFVCLVLLVQADFIFYCFNVLVTVSMLTVNRTSKAYHTSTRVDRIRPYRLILRLFQVTLGEPMPENDLTHWCQLSLLSPTVPLISLLHLLQTIVSFFFIFRLFISTSSTSYHVLFGLPLSLALSITKSVHFLTDSLSSFGRTIIMLQYSHSIL